MNEAWLAGCELATSVNDYHEVALMRPAFQNEGAGCRRHGHRPPPGHRGGWSGGCAAGEPVTLRWGTGNNLRRDRILSDEKEVLRDLYAFPGTAIANRHKLGGLKQQDVFSLSSGGQKSKVQELAGLAFSADEADTGPCPFPSFRRMPTVLGVPRLVTTSLPSLPLSSCAILLTGCLSKFPCFHREAHSNPG